jgi:hypothetical protein
VGGGIRSPEKNVCEGQCVSRKKNTMQNIFFCGLETERSMKVFFLKHAMALFFCILFITMHHNVRWRNGLIVGGNKKKVCECVVLFFFSLLYERATSHPHPPAKSHFFHVSE